MLLKSNLCLWISCHLLPIKVLLERTWTHICVYPYDSVNTFGTMIRGAGLTFFFFFFNYNAQPTPLRLATNWQCQQAAPGPWSNIKQTGPVSQQPKTQQMHRTEADITKSGDKHLKCSPSHINTHIFTSKNKLSLC